MRAIRIDEIRRGDRHTLSTMGVGRTHITALGWLKRNHPDFVTRHVEPLKDAMQAMINDAPNALEPHIEELRITLVKDGGGTLGDYYAFERYSNINVENAMADVEMFNRRQPHFYRQSVVRNGVVHRLEGQRGKDELELWFVKYEVGANSTRDCHYLVVVKDATVNEIKRTDVGRTLPSVGVGRSAVYPAYDALMNNAPNAGSFMFSPYGIFVTVVERLPRVFPDPDSVSIMGIGTLLLFHRAWDELYELVEHETEEMKFKLDEKDVSVKYSVANKVARVEVTTHISSDDSYEESFYVIACPSERGNPVK